MKTYRIWQKITRTGEIEIEDGGVIVGVEEITDKKGTAYQCVTYVVPINPVVAP